VCAIHTRNPGKKIKTFASFLCIALHYMFLCSDSQSFNTYFCCHFFFKKEPYLMFGLMFQTKELKSEFWLQVTIMTRKESEEYKDDVRKGFAKRDFSSSSLPSIFYVFFSGKEWSLWTTTIISLQFFRFEMKSWEVSTAFDDRRTREECVMKTSDTLLVF